MTTLAEKIHMLCDISDEHHADTCPGFEVKPLDIANKVTEFLISELDNGMLFGVSLSDWYSILKMADRYGFTQNPLGYVKCLNNKVSCISSNRGVKGP